MISSIQTDEARHSQQGGPTLEILVEHDPVRAQWVVDKAFWGSARAFAALTGPAWSWARRWTTCCSPTRRVARTNGDDLTWLLTSS